MNQQPRITAELNTVLIVANPSAGRGAHADLLADLERALRRVGLRPETTLGITEFGQRFPARQAAAEVRCVLAVGGDGTAAAIANITQGQVPIVIAPTGTENLLATRLGLTRDVSELVNTILRGSIQRLDVGRVNGKIFLIMFSCGFDAEVVRRVHENRQGPISRWSYAKPILDTLKSYRYPPITVHCSAADREPNQVTLEGHWTFAFNLNCYARGLKIAPKASPTDGKFDVCVLQSPSLWTGCLHFLTVATRCQGEWSGFQRLRCVRLRIESPDSVPFQIDGELGGYLPADLEVLPRWIPLVVPAGT